MTKAKALFYRFLKGAIAGAVATMLVVSLPNYQSWGEIKMWLVSLAAAGFVGGVTGGLLALDKALRWEDEQ